VLSSLVFLLYSKAQDSADNALHIIDRARMTVGRAVFLPSYIRYVRYFEQFCREYHFLGRPVPSTRVLVLSNVRMSPIPTYSAGGVTGCAPHFVCYNSYPYKNVLHNQYQAQNGRIESVNDKSVTFIDINVADKNIRMNGEVTFGFWHYDLLAKKNDPMFTVHMNTAFINSHYVSFMRHDLNAAYKDAEHFDPLFKVEFFFKFFTDPVQAASGS